MTIVKARVDLAFDAALERRLGIGKAAYTPDFRGQVTQASNPAGNLYGGAFTDVRTLGALETDNLNLSDLGRDAFGQRIVFGSVNTLIISADAANTNDVLVGGATGEAAAAFFGGQSDQLRVKPGGMAVFSTQDPTGYIVLAGIQDILRIANGGDGTPVTYTIKILGVSPPAGFAFVTANGGQSFVSPDGGKSRSVVAYQPTVPDFQIGALNMAASNAGLAISQGVALDPPYVYACPHNEGIIAKIDTRTFTVVATLDLNTVGPNMTGFRDTFIRGGYLYLLPHYTTTGPYYQPNAVRVDLSNFTAAGVSTLATLAANANVIGRDGFTDGTWGYINVATLSPSLRLVVTRFGLGSNFNSGSVSSIAFPDILGFPLRTSTDVVMTCDAQNIYIVAPARTVPPTPAATDQRWDIFLIAVPLNNFSASAATITKVTNFNYPGVSIPKMFDTIFDDGNNLWLFPGPILGGPNIGQNGGALKIPKVNPRAATLFPAATVPPQTTQLWGKSFYDGWRYGYGTSQTNAQVLQLDTWTGLVSTIDISASSTSPMWGLVSDGDKAYAVSFNGAGGQMLRLRPVLAPSS